MGTSRPVPSCIAPTSTKSPEQKAAFKKQLKDQVKGFKDAAHAGINVALLNVDEWRYGSAKFFLNRHFERMFIQDFETVDDDNHEYLLDEVEGVYSFWEAQDILPEWYDGEKTIEHNDRNRAIVIVCGQEEGERQTICLLVSDANARAVFVSSMKILLECQKQSQPKLPMPAKSAKYWDYAAAPEKIAQIPLSCVRLPLPTLLQGAAAPQFASNKLANFANEDWLDSNLVHL